jgi:predicted Zn-dependent protease
VSYLFPAGFYGDVRIEDVFETSIQVTLGDVEEMRERPYKAAFVRLFDGKMWYYASTTDLSDVQHEIDRLAAMGTPSGDIATHPVVVRYEVNTGDHRTFAGDKDIATVPIARKMELLTGYADLLDGKKYVGMWRAMYVDQRKAKHFVSSKGADLTFDTQRVGFRLYFELAEGDKRCRERFDSASDALGPLQGHEAAAVEKYNQAVHFLLHSVNVEPGDYPVILSPEAAGVFAHESFGHKSEADFMIGDETMKEEWQIGKQVGASMLSIVEDGRKPGSGYVPFDDEGTAAREHYLIKDGRLAGRLHSGVTAAALDEDLTGNARAVNFEYEPIVRMTTTYIKEGSSTLDELISGVDTGVIVETITHGSGMSTFTMAPSLAYMIRDGKRAEPVRIAVVTGDVFTTLGAIDGLSSNVELLSFVLGGCGKGEQMPLPVGFGGPWVRIKQLSVR